MKIKQSGLLIVSGVFLSFGPAYAATIGPFVNPGSPPPAVIASGDIVTGATAIGNDATITTLTNNGTVGVAGVTNTAISNGPATAGTITTLTNNGSITGDFGIIQVTSGSQIGTLINNGSIVGDTNFGINLQTGTAIGTLDNHGSITTNSGLSALYIAGGASITTLNNYGTFNGGAFGGQIINSGTIGTLNNAQNGLVLVNFFGNMPSRYNVIINSTSNYGTVDFSSINGSTTFGVSALSTLTPYRYQQILMGVGASGIVGLSSNNTLSGSLGRYNWLLQLQNGQSDIWDLLVTAMAPIGPNAANTLSTVQQSAAGLATTYNVQAAALQAGLTYDCNTFDKYGLCASIGGRTGYALTAPVGNQQAGLLVVSHRRDDHFRYGAFADQSVNSSMPNGIKQNNSGPMYGIFGYWNHQKDGMGLGASLTTAFSNSNLTVTRNNSLASTEAGSGNTEMSGQAIQAQGTYAIQATDRIKAIPYAGLRYYRVATGGYSEGANANVTSPLTYNGMSQEVFAAVGGVGASVFLAEKLTGTASVGIQQNLNYKMGNYQGTSAISGLESFSVNMPSNINSMATATAGMSYAVKKNEKLGVNVLWQQQAFSATNTITALATYSIGF